MSHNPQSNVPTNQAGTHTTMERIAAHIPGTTEHAERRHANLVREGLGGTGNVGTGNMGTGNMTRDPYATQAAAGHPPAAGTMPGTMPGTHQQFGAYTGPTAAAAPPTMGQPGFDQRHYNTEDPVDPRLAPTTGQKAAGKTKAGMGRLVGNERMEAEGIQKASGGAYADTQPGTTRGQPGGYPPPNF